jgi:hypothetical protein
MDEADRLDELRRWRAEAFADFETAQINFAAAHQRLEACRERAQLLDRLLTVEGASDAPTSSPASSIQAAQEVMGTRDDFLDACERLISDAGRPLHIKELRAALLNEGIPVPGRGTEANLLVRLHRSNGRFVRTGRGTYAPVSLGVKEVRPTQRRRVRARSAK